ncbi:LysR family transcriptional regulator [Bifidobacterium callimiconis]|uniref:LysR family transcriptional regulator n=1 Tax=Bifidobacterium callimiconis TaxID=2306973 RepID=A0A430FFT6_9BIFI|nr:LysR family transcriptional regulator [Bifidobacterium callimiconis]MBT1176035.1 LysR family transcriptional regulator [Bifidobacterium callimiconis]RSX51622.1 LysR family transcriptional regulator [Bifidobacterium callimiconis]
MELRVLRYFLAVAEEGNITWAAQLLRVSQPTLSRQLKQLEEELGVTLFHRGPHTITLTDEGRLLRERAQTIISLADKTEIELKQSENELSGEIVIGCGEVRAMTFLSQRMAAFRNLHPNVRFQVTSTTSDVIQDRIEQGLMDFGLLTEPIDVSQYEYFRPDIPDHWGILVPEHHPLAAREAITPDDLAGAPLILPARESVRKVLANWFGTERAERLVIAGYCNLPSNGANMTANGMGLFMCYDLGNTYPGVRVIPLSPALTCGTVFVWKKQGVRSPAAAEFERFVNS